MKQVLNSQQVNTGTISFTQRKATTAVLWTLQALLALIFLGAGSMKLLMPVEAMVAQMPLQLPGLFIHFIGVCEVLGGLGLILPALTRIWRALTPLAAWALALEMVGAIVYTLLGNGGASALSPLAIGLLCVVVAWGRRALFARA